MFFVSIAIPSGTTNFFGLYSGLSVVLDSIGSILKSIGRGVYSRRVAVKRAPKARAALLARDVRGPAPPRNFEIPPSKTLFSAFLRSEKPFFIPGS